MGENKKKITQKYIVAKSLSSCALRSVRPTKAKSGYNETESHSAVGKKIIIKKKKNMTLAHSVLEINVP